MIILSLVAGVAGTGIGGVIGVFLKNKGSKVMSRVLSFAGGVMVGIVAFEMVPEAVSETVVDGKDWTGVLIAVSSVVVGILSIYGLNKLLDVLENVRDTHRKPAELHHETAILELNSSGELGNNGVSKKRMLKAGLVMLFAIALHNFPEGMAIGASGLADKSAGILVAIMIAVHDIPEGMAVSVPLISGGMNKPKAVFMTALSGVPTIIGAMLGFWLGEIGALGLALSLGFASGAMLYVVFGEILPQSILMYHSKLPAFSAIVGILVGLLIIF